MMVVLIQIICEYCIHAFLPKNEEIRNERQRIAFAILLRSCFFNQVNAFECVSFQVGLYVHHFCFPYILLKQVNSLPLMRDQEEECLQHHTNPNLSEL